VIPEPRQAAPIELVVSSCIFFQVYAQNCIYNISFK